MTIKEFFQKFSNKKPEWNVIEVPETHVVQVEDEESIRSLAIHPGFLALTRRFALQKAALQMKLNKTHHKDLREVDNLQLGMSWLDYLNGEVNKLVFRRAPEKVVPAAFDAEAQFKQILTHIESV
jgi:hypothetical protein